MLIEIWRKLIRGFFVFMGSMTVLFVLVMGFVKVLAGEEITDLHRQYWVVVLLTGVMVAVAGGRYFGSPRGPRRLP